MRQNRAIIENKQLTKSVAYFIPTKNKKNVLFVLQKCTFRFADYSKLGKDNIDKAPDKGYCASQGMYYYGYKLHAVCGLSGVIHSYDLTRASVHDLKYLNDVQADYHDCVIIGDKGYISQPLQLDLFVTANIDLKAQRRKNQKDYQPPQKLYTKARKRIETIFSQLADQYMIERNYAKQTRGFFTRIKSKIAALTFAQYFNFINHKPIGRVKYAI